MVILIRGNGTTTTIPSKFWGRSGNGKDGNKRIEPCKECGKNHSGRCLKGKNVCFNCGQEGHISSSCPAPRRNGCFVCGALDHQARNCPKKSTTGGSGGSGVRGTGGGNLTIAGPPTPNRPTARTFNMTVQDAVASRDIVSGTNQ